MATLLWDRDKSIYILDSTYDERLIPKEAGFRWNPEWRAWWTNDDRAAAKLRRYATGQAAGRLDEHAEREKRSIEASRAVDAGADLPAPSGLEYRPFQRAGVAYAMLRDGTLIADEMGLGKTIQAAGVVNADDGIERVLVVCPASLTRNWERELNRWLTRPKTIAIAEKTVPEAAVLIVPYSRAVQHADALRAVEWDLAVLDESHYVKNHKAQRTIALLGYWDAQARKRVPGVTAAKRLALTGTPILNRPIELFPVLNWLNRKEWPSVMAYAKEFCAGHRTAFGWDFTGASNLGELQRRLRASTMVRRLKRDVLAELPPKQRQLVVLSPSDERMRDAIAAEAAAVAQADERIREARLRVELAKASDDPQDYADAIALLRRAALVAFEDTSAVRQETALAKTPSAIEHLDDVFAAGGKVVVFAHHKAVVAALREALAEHNPAVVTGDTPTGERQEAVDAFQQDDRCRAFIGSIGAAGVGLTLTASSTVVFVELDWVPANMTQAEDRCHRIGQRDNVLAQHIVLDGSLDMRMAELIIEKQEIADQGLDLPAPTTEPVVPEAPAARTAAPIPSRDRIGELADRMGPEDVGFAHGCIRTLSAMCDEAHLLDGVGFSKLDAGIGKSLAEAAQLSPRQGALALTLATRYKNTQLSAHAERIDEIRARVADAARTPPAHKAEPRRRAGAMQL